MLHPPKYHRTFHWHTSPGVGSDDKILRDASRLIGVEVVITEKLDGGNTCLFNGEAYARSTGLPATDGWFAMVKKHHAWKTLGAPYHFYGEDIYGIHSIVYSAVKETETFRLFNVHEGNTWMAWDDVELAAQLYGFLTVPVLFRGVFNSEAELSKWLLDNSTRTSSIGGACEGFVIRVARAFSDDEFATCVAKWVRAGHVQTDQHWRRNWRPCNLVKDESN